MSIPTSTILLIISLIVFFIVHLFYTQIIYQNKFKQFFIFSILYFLLLIGYSLNQNKIVLLNAISFGSICLIYYVLLRLLKIKYKAINSFFIRKNWVNKKYADKDFTFVYLDDGVIDDYWDEKLATPPSWLDKMLTFLLSILPISLITLMPLIIIPLFE